MEVFINECSLEEQYSNPFDFVQSVKKFSKILHLLKDINKENKVFKSRNFFNSKAITGSHLGSTLEKNPSLNALFNTNFEKVNPKKWQDEQKHDDKSSYKINGNEYVSTSIAEIAEREHLNVEYIGCLLNFEESSFSNLNEVNIIKDQVNEIKVNCFTDENYIYNWLVEKKFIVSNLPYDETSKYPPTDVQSIVSNTKFFDTTNYPTNHGRKVFIRKGTNELWVLDNLHIGKKLIVRFSMKRAESTWEHLLTMK